MSNIVKYPTAANDSLNNKKRKRAALCLSGQMRNLQKTYNQWVKKNLFEQNPNWDIDVFAHTWFEWEDIGKRYQLVGNRGDACVPIPNNILEILYKFYNPKKALIEKQVNFNKWAFHPKSGRPPHMRISKMYSIKQTSLLKMTAEQEEDFKYDAVIMSRYDMGICPIKLDKYNMQHYNTSSRVRKQYTDVTHAIMGSEVFDIFAKELYQTAVHDANQGNIILSDETYATQILNKNNITITRDPDLRNYTLVRK